MKTVDSSPAPRCDWTCKNVIDSASGCDDKLGNNDAQPAGIDNEPSVQFKEAISSLRQTIVSKDKSSKRVKR